MSQLATRSGYDRSNLRRVEEGKMSLTPETAQKLAEALDVDVEVFYDAIWQTSDDPLPSLPVYFRHRYQDLTPEQISEVEAMVNAMHRQNQQHRR
ncbi:hypothetical protein AS181_22135 [Gordonia sp. SGD-V-85]|nr:hypothetical protein AS181_22135 [Gordonia sp. SGD-V-85]